MSEKYSGFSFPFHIDASGRVAWTSGPEKLKENIKHILLTGLGERVMRRDYGGGLRQLVHDPNKTRCGLSCNIGSKLANGSPG